MVLWHSFLAGRFRFNEEEGRWGVDPLFEEEDGSSGDSAGAGKPQRVPWIEVDPVRVRSVRCTFFCDDFSYSSCFFVQV